MKTLFCIIIGIKDNIKDNIHEYGCFKGLIRAFKSTWTGLLFILVVILLMIFIGFEISKFISFAIGLIAKYPLQSYTSMGGPEVTIGIIITEIGLLLLSGIPLLKHKFKQRFIVCFCAIVLTLGGIFIGLDGINKYCYFNVIGSNGAIVASYGLISKDIFYRAHDINFVKIYDEVTYKVEYNGKSTIRTGPFQSRKFIIYLRDGKCLEMEELKSKYNSYLYTYLTDNNVRIVNEKKGL